jgi:hypothetical protein
MKNLVWRVFQCVEIVGVKNWKIFLSDVVYNLIISNTYVSHQQMCVMETEIHHGIQICQSNIQTLKYTQESFFYFQ